MTPERSDRIVRLLVLGVGLAILALMLLRHGLGWDPLAALPGRARAGMAGLGGLLLVLGALTCAVNVWLGLLLPWLHRREHGDAEAWHGPSGLPVIGSLFLGGAALLLPPHPALGLVLLGLYLLDASGLPRIMLLIARGEA